MFITKKLERAHLNLVVEEEKGKMVAQDLEDLVMGKGKQLFLK